MKKQASLFETTIKETGENPKGKIIPPLAHLSRPKNFEEFIGHEAVFKNYPFLKSPHFPSIILTGPSGSGKTTLARILATHSNKEFYKFNAVLGGIPELKKLIAEALEIKGRLNHEVVIFIDEIHRFNKAQQDALLPYIEEGDFILIGATTESPRTSINKALLSRVQIIHLNPLSENNITAILKRARDFSETGKLPDELIQIIANFSNGDARVALNILEEASKFQNPTALDIKNLIIENARAYDRGGNRHYDVISAFIKSMRGSDPQSAILWLAVMIEGGEDPIFIARRLVIFASEDVGNADPTALTLATSGLTAISNIGMPEARIILAQVTTYLASTYKSNSSYLAINEALDYVKSKPTIDVPDFLKNYPPKHAAEKYLYPHNYPNHFVHQHYNNENNLDFYRPTQEGKEDGILKRLQNLWRNSKK
jgi:putative ATPase